MHCLNFVIVNQQSHMCIAHQSKVAAHLLVQSPQDIALYAIGSLLKILIDTYVASLPGSWTVLANTVA